jgi:ABC-type glutathione transport system ATPase component
MTNGPAPVAIPRGERSDGDMFMSVRDLRKVYGERAGDSVTAVDSVSFDIAPGRTLGLVGESGSGKSTIARLMMGLERPTAGTAFVAGIEISRATRPALRSMRRSVQIVLQDPLSSLNRRQNIGSIVAAPLAANGLGSRDDRRRRVITCLELVGLGERYLSRLPRELSGGQCQRVSIARALTLEPRGLILDEAVAALDLAIRSQILNLLRDLQEQFGLTYLFISHDLAVVRYMSEDISVIQRGRIVEADARDQLFAHPKHPYTQSLLGAILEPPALRETP